VTGVTRAKVGDWFRNNRFLIVLGIILFVVSVVTARLGYYLDGRGFRTSASLLLNIATDMLGALTAVFVISCLLRKHQEQMSRGLHAWTLERVRKLGQKTLLVSLSKISEPGRDLIDELGHVTLNQMLKTRNFSSVEELLQKVVGESSALKDTATVRRMAGIVSSLQSEWIDLLVFQQYLTASQTETVAGIIEHLEVLVNLFGHPGFFSPEGFVELLNRLNNEIVSLMRGCTDQS
jgi:hypothetical protein